VKAVVELHDVEDHRAAADLLARVWGRDDEPPVGAELLVALAHSGNFVAGAERDGALVGASVGFLGRDDGPILHSHITGVAPVAQGQGVGLALKRFQWEWARDRGLVAITWTFDPLVRRNGWFNLVRLGAVATSFVPNLYGTVEDAFNAGGETDRCWVRWDVGGPEAGADAAPVEAAGATVVLEEDADGLPRSGPLAGDRRLVGVPADIVDLRAHRPDLADAWREAVREVLGASMAEGFAAVGMTSAGGYLLERRS
jgi:predicted GNAT superfamily acetyltransferase